jgi:hypothetical protein
MHKAEVAALQEYEDALTEFLTSVRAARWSLRFSIHGRVDCKNLGGILRMLSGGPLVSHFSPSQDIRLIKSASHRMVMYITDKFP